VGVDEEVAYVRIGLSEHQRLIANADAGGPTLGGNMLDSLWGVRTWQMPDVKHTDVPCSGIAPEPQYLRNAGAPQNP
jgi:hypothetical protein